MIQGLRSIGLYLSPGAGSDFGKSHPSETGTLCGTDAKISFVACLFRNFFFFPANPSFTTTFC
jgi:hypothetical protein